MKKIIFLVLLCLPFGLFAQKGKGNQRPEEEHGDDFPKKMTAQKEAAYQLALRYMDYVSASQAVLDILSLNPTEIRWKDTLAILYFEQERYPQCLRVTEEILGANPNNTMAIKMQAISYDVLGAKKQSLDLYERLYPLTKDVYDLYQIATHQYELARLGECSTTLAKLMDDPRVNEKNVSLSYNNKQQEVPMKAAVLNMMGVVAQTIQRKEEAKSYFEEALKIMPDFELAAGNLEALLRK